MTTTTTETVQNVPEIPATAAKPARAAVTAAKPTRPMEVNVVRHPSVIATVGAEEGPTEQIRPSVPVAPRSFTDRQRAMLAAWDKSGDVKAIESEPVAVAPAAASPDATAPAAETPVPAVAAAPTAVPDQDIAARAERLAEYNKRLLAENEQLRATPTRDPDPRLKALDEIERSLTTDSVGSLRRLVALNAGIEDPASPDVDRLMSGIYAEWTAHELKMAMDPAQRAAIGVDRNRLLIERDRRDREAAAKATEAKAAAEAERQRDESVGRQIDQRLESDKHAERYPLMMKYSKLFDKSSPGSLLWSAIRTGIQAGEFAPNTPDDVLIHHYSKAIETHYQDLHGKIVGAQPSAAPPTQPTVSPIEKKVDAPESSVKPITNVSASVVPPNVSVPATPTVSADKTPKFRSEEERRRYYARLHFGE